MSDQGEGAGQWRPATHRTSQEPAPDDMTGPIPKADDDVPGFPPVADEPAANPQTYPSDTDGFTPAENNAPRPENRPRSPFEPADDGPPASGPPADAPDDAYDWSTFDLPDSSESVEPKQAPARFDPPADTNGTGTPPFGAEIPTFGTDPESPSFAAQAPDTSAYSDTGAGAFGASAAPYGDTDTGSLGAQAPSSYGAGSGGSAYDSGSYGPGASRSADEQAEENDFFAPDDQAWDKQVAPTGPPPQPGRPSSGNLRMPDWMRDEQRQGGPGGPGEAMPPDSGYGRYDDDEEGKSSRMPLFLGVGVLAVALVVAGGVFFLKSGGKDDPKASGPQVASPKASHSKSSKPSKPQQPEKELAFPGPHDKAAGRVKDNRAGLSYPRFGKPWAVPGKKSPMTEIGFSASQFAVTEQAGGKPKSWARLMSGVLGGAEKNLYGGAGTERRSAAELAGLYEDRMYGFRHKKKVLANQSLTVGGHKGWLVAYALTYHRPGVKAQGDALAVALVDTGKKAPGVVVMSAPLNAKKLLADIGFVAKNIKVT